MKIIFYILFFSSFALSQTFNDKLLYITSNKIDLNYAYQSLKIGNDKLEQLSLPVNILIPITSHLSLDLWNGSALTKFIGNEIKSIGETRLGVKYIFPSEKFMIKALIGLPTGKTKFSDEEFLISQLISLNPLGYPISYYSQGLNVNLSLIYAYPISKNFVLGLGCAYNYKGNYYPKETTDMGKFDPGDEIISDFGFDVKISKKIKFNFDFVYTVFAKDKIGDIEVFKMGNKISLYTGLNYIIGITNNNLFVIYRKKSNNKLLSENSTEELASGAQIDMNYLFELLLNTQLTPYLVFDGKIYQSADQLLNGELVHTGKSTVLGFGLGLRYNTIDFLQTEVYYIFKTGDIVLPPSTEKLNISGSKIGCNLLFRF